MLIELIPLAQHVLAMVKENSCKVLFPNSWHLDIESCFSNRKIIKTGVQIRLDLTKDRYNFLPSAKKMLKTILKRTIFKLTSTVSSK